MRIGINLRAMTKSDSFRTVTSPTEYKRMIKKVVIDDEFKRVMDEIEKEGHEVFVFAPAPVELSDKMKIEIKKRIIKRLKAKGIDISKVTIVGEDDVVASYRRNHMGIVIDSDKSSVEGASEFTDAIEASATKTTDALIEELIENVNANRKAYQLIESEPGGLPSEERIWLQYYSVGDMKWKDERMSPYDRLISSNIDWKDEVAMEFFGFKYTYAHFFREIDRMADHLLAKGVRKGMKVPFIFANTPEAMFTLYALYKIKATIVPLSPLIRKPEIELKPKLELIEQQNKENGFNQSYFFITDALYDKMKSGIPEGYTTVVEPLTNSMPKVVGAVMNMVLRLKQGLKPPKYSDKVLSYNDFVSGEVPHVDVDTSFDNDYDAVQLYTGGSIRPKAVILSEGNVDATARQFYNDRFDFRRRDKIAAFMPLHHSFGLIIGTHVAATLGVVLDLIPKIDFNKIYSYFIKDKVNIFGGIPNMFASIINDPKLANADLSNVKYILSGGSTLKQAVRESTDTFFREHNSSAEVKDGYGQTEVGGGIIYDGIPNIGADVKIVIPGTDEEVGYETLGELCLSGPQVMRYYDERDLNDAVFMEDKNGKVWLRTGDAAIIHRDGRVEYRDRLDRMIKINGEQVILTDLEELFNQLPFVEDCVVVGVPHEKKDHSTYAFIKLAEGIEPSPEIEKMLQECAAKTIPTGSHRPIAYDIQPEFPKTAVGKNDFKTLGQMALEKMQEAKSK